MFNLKLKKLVSCALLTAIVFTFTINFKPYTTKSITTSKAQQINTINRNLLVCGSKKTLTKDFNINIINTLPTNIINNLYKNNYKISLQQNLINLQNNKIATAQAITDSVDHYIIIANSTNNATFLYQNSFTLLHEIGHTWDNGQGYHARFSDDKTWNDIRTKESSKLFNTSIFNNTTNKYLSYYKQYNDEYYAECFAMYFYSTQSRQILKDNAIESYYYIKYSIEHYN